MSSRTFRKSLMLRGGALVAVMLAAGCTLRAVREAPIEDKSSATRAAPARPAPAAVAMPAAPAVSGREATNGTYVVQRGDTLYSIAVAFGQDYRDLARWNNLEDPTRLAVGQTLRVSAPEGDTGSAPVVGVVAVTPSATTETRPLEAVTLPPLPPAPAPAPAAGPAPAPVTPAPAPAGTPGVPPAADGGAPRPSVQAPAANAGLFWQWPARGKVIDGYHEARNKGIDIGGNEGDAVLAAGDGEIVYSGNGLRMYGNLVIIKHSDDYISAYAHNKQILVKQGQAVKRGQRIADLGRTDDGQAKLHFEIRYRGKPVDPMKYLPPR